MIISEWNNYCNEPEISEDHEDYEFSKFYKKKGFLIRF